jgi:hypothetical protein
MQAIMTNIGEGSLAIPATWYNASVNIFSVTMQGGLSITITRDQLASGMALADYAQQQIASLPQKLGNFTLLQQHARLLDSRPGSDLVSEPTGIPAHYYEFIWHSPQQGLIHQMLMCAARGKTVLNFSGTQVGRMSEAQHQQLWEVLGSFRFE